MLIRIILIAVVVFLSACGGSSVIEQDDDYSELRLTDLTVYDYDMDFDPEKTGEYLVTVNSDVDMVTVNFDYVGSSYSVSYVYQNQSTFVADELEGKSITIELEEGNNNLALNISSEDSEYPIAYYLNVYRIYSSASIESYKMTGTEDVSNEYVFSPSFSSSVFDYKLTVPYDVCAVVSEINTNNAETIIETNNIRLENGEISSQNLIVGRNIIDTFVTSEDGATTERYSVEVTRFTPTEQELSSNARLGNIEIDGLDFEYQCGVNSFIIPIDSNKSQFSIEFFTEVEGARIYIGDIEIPSGEAYVFEQHNDIYILQVNIESEDRSATKSYEFAFVRRQRNVIEVSTSEELIHALENANPNDEIRISAGTYSNAGELYEENTHFWSSRSGTFSQPIYLIGLNSDDPVTFSSGADDLLFKLEGDNWVISGIDFENARQAIDISNASNVVVSNSQFKNINENAIELDGAAKNNLLSDLEFSQIGMASENSDRLYSAVLLQGDVEHYPSGNTIRFNTFARSSAYQSITVDTHSVDTTIENNRFIEDDELSLIAYDQHISLSGHQNIVRYNYFDFREGDNFEYLIETMGEERESQIYQNLFWLENEGDGAILASAGHITHSEENLSLNDNSIEITGSGILRDTKQQPIYEIKPTNDESKCLGVLNYDDDNLDVNFVVLQDCSNSPEQQWLVEAHKSGYVYIKNQGFEEDQYLRPVYGYQDRCAGNPVSSFVFLGEKNEDWNVHWRINSYDDDNIILNRQSEEFALSVSGGNLESDSPIVACVFSGSDLQQYKLVNIN